MKPELNKIYQGDTLEVLKTWPDEFVDCVVTSPPYWGLRDYGVDGQLGSEETIDGFIDNMLLVTAELKRVLKKTGTMFWNHGDSYGSGSGSGIRTGKQATNRGTQSNAGWQKNGKRAVVGYEKSLMLQAHRLAIRMVDEQGWILRNTLIWHKPNAMPSSVKDRFGVDYEPVFFFTKAKKYWFEQQREKSLTGVSGSFNLRVRDAKRGYKKSGQYKASSKEMEQYHGQKIKTADTRGLRSVWTVSTRPFKGAHFATFPEQLITPMVLAGCPQGGVLLDCFMGSGTSALVAKKLSRSFLGIELNPKYIKMAQDRLKQGVLL